MSSPAQKASPLRTLILGIGAFWEVVTILAAQPVTTVGELLARVVERNYNVHYFVIPVAGHVDGAGSTEFRSDVTILSLAATPQRVAVAWLAQGTDSSAQPLHVFSVGPTPAFFADMVATTLGQTGLGALVIMGVNRDGSPDLTARLTGFARVWTPVPGCAGTSSLAVEPTRFEQDFATVATGLRLDAGHRGTIGVVNPGTETRTFEVYSGGGPFEISVPPASMIPIPMPQAAAGPGRRSIFSASTGKPPMPLRSIRRLADGWFVKSFEGFLKKWRLSMSNAIPALLCLAPSVTAPSFAQAVNGTVGELLRALREQPSNPASWTVIPIAGSRHRGERVRLPHRPLALTGNHAFYEPARIAIAVASGGPRCIRGQGPLHGPPGRVRRLIHAVPRRPRQRRARRPGHCRGRCPRRAGSAG